MMARLSGLQREVLSLYRKCLREIRKKPVVSSSSAFTFPGLGKLLSMHIANFLVLFMGPGIKKQL